MRRCALILLLLWSAGAAGQDVERDVATLRTDFEYGKYEEVLRDAQARLDRGVNDPRLLVEIHKVAGVSAFNLGRMEVAERHLTSLLRIDPDYTLDPFVFPPPVVEFHEQIRTQLGPELQFIRQSRELQETRRRAERAEAERDEAEAERKRLAAIPRRVTTQTVERRSYFVNFVPFGAGQFQQERTQLGIWLASLQGATAATSIIAYWAYEALLDEKTFVIPGGFHEDGRPLSLTVRGIPPGRLEEAATWTLIKTISAITFYALYAYGVIDALVQHQDTIVTTNTTEEPLRPSTVVPAPSGPRGLQQRAGPQAFPYLFPTPGGGVGAGLELRF